MKSVAVGDHSLSPRSDRLASTSHGINLLKRPASVSVGVDSGACVIDIITSEDKRPRSYCYSSLQPHGRGSSIVDSGVEKTKSSEGSFTFDTAPIPPIATEDFDVETDPLIIELKILLSDKDLGLRNALELISTSYDQEVVSKGLLYLSSNPLVKSDLFTLYAKELNKISRQFSVPETIISGAIEYLYIPELDDKAKIHLLNIIKYEAKRDCVTIYGIAFLLANLVPVISEKIGFNIIEFLSTNEGRLELTEEGKSAIEFLKKYLKENPSKYSGITFSNRCTTKYISTRQALRMTICGKISPFTKSVSRETITTTQTTKVAQVEVISEVALNLEQAISRHIGTNRKRNVVIAHVPKAHTNAGEHDKWYWTTEIRVNNLLELVELNGELLLEGDIEYLSNKLFGTQWNFAIGHGDQINTKIVKIFRIISEKGQSIPGSVIDKLIKCVSTTSELAESQDQWFHTPQASLMREMRDDALRAIDSNVKSGHIKLSPAHMSSLKDKLSVGELAPLKSRMLRALSFSGDDSSEVFNHFFDCLKRNDDALFAMDSIIRQLSMFDVPLRKSKEGLIITDYFSLQHLTDLASVLSFSTPPRHEDKVRLDCAIAIGMFFNKLSTESSARRALEKYYIATESHIARTLSIETNQEICFKTISIVIGAAENKYTISPAILDSLTQKFSAFDRKNQNLIILLFDHISKTPEIFVPIRVDAISIGLSRSEVVICSESEPISFAVRSDSTMKNPSIARITSEVILKQSTTPIASTAGGVSYAKTRDLDISTLTNCIELLLSPSEHEAQLLISRALPFQIVPYTLLDKIFEASFNPSKEISTNLRLCFLKSVSEQRLISKEMVKKIIDSYEYEDFFIGGLNIAVETNSLVLSKIIKYINTNVSLSTDIPEEIFNIINHLICNSERRDNKITKIMRLCAVNQVVFPQSTVEYLEALFNNETSKSATQEIIERIIINGQIVSENIIKFYSDKILSHSSSEERDSAFTILTHISDNQEISNDYYKIYQLEVLGRQLIISPSPKAVEYLRDAIISREVLTQTHFDFILKNIHYPGVLETLEAASKNGQNIPELIIQKLYEAFCDSEKNTQIIVQIFSAIVQNNQILHDQIIHSLGLTLENPTLRENILAIFIKNFSHGQPISQRIFSAILEECANNLPFRGAYIGILSSLVKANEIENTDLPYLIAIISRSIEGRMEYEILHSTSIMIDLISKKPELLEQQERFSLSRLVDTTLPSLLPLTTTRLMHQSFRLIKANLCNALASLIDFAAKHDSSLALKERVLSISTIPHIQSIIPSNIKLQFDLLALYKKSDLEIINTVEAHAKSTLLFEVNYIQIAAIISRSPHLHDRIVGTLLSLSPENKAHVSEELLESITNLLFSSDKNVKIAAIYFISECIQAGKIMPQVVMKSLTMIISSDSPKAQVEPAITALTLASQRQPLNPETLLSLQIARETGLSSVEFDKILKDLKNSRKISNSTIAKLLKASVSQELTKSDLIKLAEIFSILLLRGDVTPRHEIVLLVESTIADGHVGISLLAYEKILELRLCCDYEKALPLILDLSFENITDGDFSFIPAFRCLQNFINNYGYRLSAIHINLLEANLDSDNILLRHLSFRILRAAQEKDSEYLVPQYAELSSQDDDKSAEEVLEALDTVIFMKDDSYDYSLRELKKFFEKLLCHNTAEHEILRVSLRKLEGTLKYKKDDPREIHLLKLLTEKLITRRYTLENITELISLLPSDHNEIVRVLSHFEDPILRLKLEKLESIITSKTSLNPNDIFFELMDDSVHGHSLLSIYGIERLTNLFSKLDAINSLTHYQKIVEFLHTHKDASKFLDELKYYSLETCLTELQIAILSAQLNTLIAFNGHTIDKEKFGRIITKMITSLGWQFDDFQGIYCKITASTAEHTLRIIEVINDYEIKNDKYSDIISIISSPNPHKWVINLNKSVINSRFAHKRTIKSIDQLISELPESFTQVDKLKYKDAVLKIRDSSLYSAIALPILISPISSWSAAEIAEWSKVAKLSKGEGISSTEMIAVLKKANFLDTGFELTDTQILSLLVILDKPLEQGRLLQVATGEGKSTIISLLATIGVIRGKKVDIITSSPVLARRDADDKKDFYGLLGISVADNADKSIYITGEKTCYLQDIVYGDVSQFQFDTLRDEYSGLETLGGRQKELVIVDEVDSMLIDDSSKIAQLSTTMAGMEHLEHIYHLIHNEFIHRIPYLYQPPGTTELYEMHERVVYDKGNAHMLIGSRRICLNQQFPDGNIPEALGHRITLQDIKTQIQDYIKAKIADNSIQIPAHLRKFVDYQLETKWVEAAISAILSFDIEQDYVIGDDERLIRRIKPVDFESTGIVQSSTNWSDGLHQFLQIKHALYVTSESLTTNFLSNTGYFKRYGPNLYGFTGTLGSDKAKEVLSETYNVDYASIPSLREKRYIQFQTQICMTVEEHDKSIIGSSLKESSKGRGVLVICETIAKAKDIARQLQENPLKPRVILYVMNDMDQENAIKSIRAGEIIVATNLAGRGTDIKTTEIEECGGLHVCLTFLPHNLRVEQQALGRTARQGNLGTAQIICMADTDDSIKLQEVRDNREKEILQKFQAQDIGIIKCKDDLFYRFCELLKFARAALKSQSSSRDLHVLIEGDTAWEVVSNFAGRAYTKAKDGVVQLISGAKDSVYETCNIAALEERWGIFFKQLTDIEYSHAGSIEAKFEIFEKEVKEDIARGTLISNPYHCISIGNDDLAKQEYARAIEQFDRAIMLDPQFSAAAHYGKAVCLIYQAQDKTVVLTELNLCLNLVQSELAMLYQMKSLYPKQTATTAQLTERIVVIETFLNNIQTAISVIEKSQRLIDLKLTSSSEINSLYKLEKDDAIRRIADVRDEVEVNFNSLIRWHDCGDRDEAEGALGYAIQILGKSYNGVILSVDLESSLAREIISQDKYYSGCKDGAMEVIKKEEKKCIKESSGFWRAMPSFGRASAESSSLDLVKLKITSIAHLEIPNIKPDLAKKIIESTKELNVVKFRIKTPGSHIDIETSNLSKTRALEEISRRAHKVNIEILTDNNEYSFSFPNHSEALQAVKAVSGDSSKFDITFVGANQLAKLGVQTSIEFIELSKTKTLDKLTKIQSDDDIVDIELCCEDTNEIVKAIDVYASVSMEKVHILYDSHWLILDHAEARSRIVELDGKVIKFLKIDSTNALAIANSVTEGIFTIRYASFDLTKLTHNLDNGLDTKLQMRNINKTSASRLIDHFRTKKQEFQLGFTGLSSSKARELIEKIKHKIPSEEITVASTFELEDIIALDKKPREELLLMSKRGINNVVHLTEKGHVQWRSIIAVCGLAALQIGAGIFLMATGIAATAGLGLISEGAVDLYTAYRGYKSRNFSWKGYFYQKLISVAISIASSGYQAIKNAAKNAATVTESAAQQLGQQVITEAEEQATQAVFQRGVEKASNKVAGLLSKAGEVARETGKILTAEVSTKTIIKTGAIRLASMASSALITNFINSITKDLKTIISSQLVKKFQDSEILPIIQKMRAIQNHENLALRIPEANIDRMMDEIMSEPSESEAIRKIGSTLSEFAGSEVGIAFEVIYSISEIATITNSLFRNLERKVTAANAAYLGIDRLVSIGSKDNVMDVTEADDIAKKLHRSGIFTPTGCYNRATGIFTLDRIDLGEHNKFKPSVIETLNPLCAEETLMETVNSLASIATSHITMHLSILMSTGVAIGMNSLSGKLLESEADLTTTEKIAVDTMMNPLELDGLYTVDTARTEYHTRSATARYEVIPTICADGGPGIAEPSDVGLEDVTAKIDHAVQELERRINVGSPINPVIVIGPTGVGKSTLINFLSGRQLIAEQIGANITVKAADGGELDLKTSSSFVSETIIPQQLHSPISKLSYWDCPGNWDSRGEAQQIVNAYSIDMLFKIPGHRVCIVIPESFTTRSESRHLKNFLHELSVLFANCIDIEGTFDESIRDCITAIIRSTSFSLEQIRNSFGSAALELDLTISEKAILTILTEKLNLLPRFAPGLIEMEDVRLRIVDKLLSSAKVQINPQKSISDHAKAMLENIFDKKYSDLRYNIKFLLDSIGMVIENRTVELHSIKTFLDSIIAGRARNTVSKDEIFDILNRFFPLSFKFKLEEIYASNEQFDFANSLILEERYEPTQLLSNLVFAIKGAVNIRLLKATRPNHHVTHHTEAANLSGIQITQNLISRSLRYFSSQ